MYRSTVPAGGGGPVGAAAAVGEGAGAAVATGFADGAGAVEGDVVDAALGVADPLQADTSSNAASTPATGPRRRMASSWPSGRPGSTLATACLLWRPLDCGHDRGQSPDPP